MTTGALSSPVRTISLKAGPIGLVRGRLELRLFGAEAVTDDLLRHDRMVWIGRSDEAGKASLTYGGGALPLIAWEAMGVPDRNLPRRRTGLRGGRVSSLTNSETAQAQPLQRN